jgi:phosphatidylinositol alpha-1,6-mannosyltransferase
MKKICLISPEIGKDKGGIQNWMYYVKCLLVYNNYDLNDYSYKDSKLIKLVNVYKSNVFILATWKMAIFILPMLLLTKKKVFIFVHGNEILNLNIILKSILHFLTKRKSTYFIANSQAISDLFFDIMQRKIDFIQYPFMKINKNSYEKNDKKKKNIFFTITRLVKRKNIKNVIYAFDKLKKEKILFTYNIAGNGPEIDDLIKLVSSLKLDKEVKFIGKVSEEKKEYYYQNSDFFLLPSVFDELDGSIEGYGIVFIEANAYSIPVLSGNTGGMLEAVINEKTGLHCDGSIIDIYNKIKKLIDMDFNSNYLYKHAKKHDYLDQKEFLSFFNRKLNE